jgi:hypothetical protein
MKREWIAKRAAAVARLLMAAVLLFGVSTCTVCDEAATPGFFEIGSLGEPSWMGVQVSGVFKLRTEVIEDPAPQRGGERMAKRVRIKRHFCSAFLLGDARTLWTNRHGFPYLQEAGSWRFPQLDVAQRLDFVLEDHEGRVVFDTREALDHARVEFAGRESWVESSEGEEPSRVLRASASDYVQIRLSRPLRGHVFEWAGRDPVVDEQVYAIGWPTATQTRRPSFGEPDSDGRTMRFTAGSVTADVPFDIVDWKDRREAFDAEGFQRTMFLTTADCELGMSGSPIVDAEGKVLGILSISFARRACPNSRQASGILWREIQRVRQRVFGRGFGNG